ncbi:MAG TPA: DUF1697 domain-containing protein [Candidatus Acidoferrales bacterium]|nr:DUF1697 domain-containing protein [Candidatus Acidoferrales bacterium]
MEYAALLRGINVGGNKIIKMEELRALCESLGLNGAQTLLQSGNVVFRSEEKDRDRLTRLIEGGIEKKFGFEVRVVVRSSADLRRVIAKNPFKAAKTPNLSSFLVMFLDGMPALQAFAELRSAYKGPEDMHLSGEEFYIYYTDGVGNSKLTNDLIQKKLHVTGTARNWNTVQKLLELTIALRG